MGPISLVLLGLVGVPIISSDIGPPGPISLGTWGWEGGGGGGTNFTATPGPSGCLAY